MSEAIPTADRLPLLGSALEIGRDPFHFLEEAPKTYGRVFRVSIPGLSFVCCADADLAKQVLVEKSERYRKDPHELNLLGSLLGDGLLTASGERWERGREHVQPAFYPGKLATYALDMLEQTQLMLTDWEDGQRIDAHTVATQLTLSIIARTMFGADGIEDADVITAAADAITDRFEPSKLPMEIPLWVPTPANLRYQRATDELDGVINEILHQRRNSGATDGTGERSDLCSTLVSAEVSGVLSDAEIRDHLVTMLFAGYETTAIALTYTLGLLATNPDTQNRVINEVRELEKLSPRTKLPHTDRVIREALRLYPPAYMLYRQTVIADTVAGYEIPAGTRVVLPQWAIHRSDRYYDNPHRFQPDRWTKLTDTHPEFAYFPFGGGERQCIGRRFALLELRLTLAQFLRAVRFERTSETVLSPTPALTCRPSGPVWLRVRRDADA
ncbi:cytochrome P450 (plasmid) [Haloferacaceae archaeon DSL9]